MKRICGSGTKKSTGEACKLPKTMPVWVQLNNFEHVNATEHIMNITSLNCTGSCIKMHTYAGSCIKMCTYTVVRHQYCFKVESLQVITAQAGPYSSWLPRGSCTKMHTYVK